MYIQTLIATHHLHIYIYNSVTEVRTNNKQHTRTYRFCAILPRDTGCLYFKTTVRHQTHLNHLGYHIYVRYNTRLILEASMKTSHGDNK